jgi:hypothetical protein
MRRSLLLTLVLAVAATAVALASTSSGTDAPNAARSSGPTSFSASVAGSGGTASSPADGASTARSDPTTWGQARDREYGRQSRRRMARRLTRVILASSAARLGVGEDVLTDAVRKVAAEHRRRARRGGGLSTSERAVLRACRRYRNRCESAAARGALREVRAAWPASDLAGLRDDLAAGLARQLRLPRAQILEAARAELSDRLRQGVQLGVISERARRVALDCFDGPGACDVPELTRELRAGRLLG